jgi:hypothetical protein
MLVVVDNFLNNADATRAYATGLDYFVRGNYPGARTRSHADPGWVPYLEKYTGGERVTWFDTHPLSYNGSFQLALAADGDSWVHADATDWAAVLFLGPSEAPAGAGVTLYRHRATGLLADDGSRDARAALADGNRPGAWEPAAKVANVFNRLVLFRGRQFHKSSAYFGDCAATGRLFQVLFFNTTSPPLQRFRLDREPRVLVLVFSTNRYEYLARTLAALRARVDFAGARPHVRVVDDWPAGRRPDAAHALYRAHGVDEVVEHDTNVGLGATWREAWARIAGESFDWVLHLEDDAVFERPVRVMDVACAFAASAAPLSQVFFKRQVCYDASHDFIAEIESGRAGEDGPVGSPIGVTDQRRYFVAMASLYPKLIVQTYMNAKQRLDPHEHTLRAFFGGLGMWSSMWGARGDPPTVRHVGELSRGRKVSPGDPDFARFARLPVDGDYRFDTGEPVGRQAAA